MKYIRTEDRIIDLTEIVGFYLIADGYNEKGEKAFKYLDLNSKGRFKIIKEADTIKDLVMPEDLVEVDGLDYYRIEDDRGDYLVAYNKAIIYRDKITALFINISRDPQMDALFVRVADSNGEGELELL